MSRRKLIKEEEPELVQEAEVIMRWSSKRIVIATFLVIMIIAGSIYAISLLSQNKTNQAVEKKIDKPQLEIPNEKDVQGVIDKAKGDLSNITAKNLIESQPKLKKIIDDLTHLTDSSSSAKSLICDSLCK
jgi:hypothetical protein